MGCRLDPMATYESPRSLERGWNQYCCLHNAHVADPASNLNCGETSRTTPSPWHISMEKRPQQVGHCTRDEAPATISGAAWLDLPPYSLTPNRRYHIGIVWRSCTLMELLSPRDCNAEPWWGLCRTAGRGDSNRLGSGMETLGRSILCNPSQRARLQGGPRFHTMSETSNTE